MKGNFFWFFILCSWPCIVIGLFLIRSPRKAIIAAFGAAVMFLPMGDLNQFVPVIDYNKMSATSIGIFLGILIFDAKQLGKYSYHPADLPMLVWCLCGFVSSLTNGLGPYDGFFSIVNTFLIWGMPYLAGRIYFSDADGMKLLCKAFLICGFVYIPFIIFEIRMSPQLHRIVYGFLQHSFGQTLRMGGYRPMVFMQHGLMIGLWMSMISLVGIWCIYTGVFKKLIGISVKVIVFILITITVLCKSMGALFLLFTGIAILFLSTRLKCALLI